jgi:hypothetical protein
MRITAIIAARNEAVYLPVTLRHLVDCGISLAIIDNESVDSSRDIYESFREHIVSQTSLPYKGYFSLTDQLAAKSRLRAEIASDWWIHQDADEILESPRSGESLREGIERIASAGFDTINFDEFVFTPTRQNASHKRGSFVRSMKSYYFFEPKPMRLLRAWRDLPSIKQVDGGHRVIASSPLRCCDDAFVLRHYIVLDQAHADTKYSARRFAPDDLANGWHGNRLHVPSSVVLPDESELHTLASWNSKQFTKEFPRKCHFWQREWEARRSAK